MENGGRTAPVSREYEVWSMEQQQRLAALRSEMKKRGIDIYLVPTSDFIIRNMWEIILRPVSTSADLPVLPEQ